jgi:integrase
MAVANSRRRFGSVRRLPSGRYQASWVSPDGRRRPAATTFATKTDAGRWLAAQETDLARGLWVDDTLAATALKEYAVMWLRDHPRLGPRWRETCERNLRLHLTPLAALSLRHLTPAVVRSWHADALRGPGGRTSIAQSYRFLRAVLNTAVHDGALARNPCQIPGAGADRSKERAVATPAQIEALIHAIAPRYRAAVVLGSWAGLRRGEILGLHRDDLDLSTGTVTVRRTRTEMLSTGARFDSPPKTNASYRTVALPPHIMPILSDHLERFAGTDRVFVNRDGEPMRGDALRQAFERARNKVELPDLRFHDLRHTGQTLAAAAGGSLADLMRRLGHSSTAAAKLYLHATDDRDREIAQALSKLAADHGEGRVL